MKSLFAAIKTYNPGSVFWDDLVKINSTEDPPVYPEIQMVVILSGRSSALKEWVDHPNVKDLSDDYDRIVHGIKIAETVNALRANKKRENLVDSDRVTPIFYNGRKKHNDHLRLALDEGVFNYPTRLFHIVSLQKENTIGQVESLCRNIQANTHVFDKTNAFAVVSSGFHLARVTRTLGKDSSLVEDKNIENLQILLYGIDRSFTRQGILDDLKGEAVAMEKYSSLESGNIARLMPSNTYTSAEDLFWQYEFSLMKKQLIFTNYKKNQEEKNCALVAKVKLKWK